jgi:hypothetical protein
MEKVKVTIILLLSTLSLALFYQNQRVVEENTLLQVKLSERETVSTKRSNSIVTIDSKCSENFPNTTFKTAEAAFEIVESDTVVVNEPVVAYKSSVTKLKSLPKNGNTKTIPFQEQGIDYEWATRLETAVSDVFMTSELLEEFTLENVECRSSTCEVRMPKRRDDTFHQSVLVLFALEEMGIKHHSFKVSANSEEDTVVFYFSNNDSE